MKHKKSITQAYIHRDRVILPELFRQAKAIASWPSTMKQLCTIAADLPTPCFCVSDDAALDYIRRRMLHGQVRQFSTAYKNRLFEALYHEVARLRDERHLSLQAATLRALSSPAPCVGLTPFVIQFKITRLLFRQ